MRCFECWSFPFPALDATVILLGQKLKHNYTESEQLPMGCTSMFVPPQIQYHQDGFSHVYVHACTGCCREEHIFSTSHMKCPFGVQPRLSCGSSKMAASLFLSIKYRTSSPVRRVLRWSVEWALGSQCHLLCLLPVLSL